MSGTVNFEYHYNDEAQQYTFYRVPKALIKNKFFKGISCEAKMLYGLMLDRLSLSLKNSWKDESGKVFIFYTLEDIQEDLDCSHGKAVKLLAELDSIGLIKRVKQGHGKPTKIYVKKFIIPSQNYEKQSENEDLPKEEVQTSDFEKSGFMLKESSDLPKEETKASPFEKPEPIIGEISAFSKDKVQLFTFEKPKLIVKENPDFQKEEVQTSHFEKSRLPDLRSVDFQESESNYNYISENNKNNNECINNHVSQSSQSNKEKADRQDNDDTDNIARKIEAYTELIKENIGYNDLLISRKFDIGLINEFINIILDVILTVGNYVRISGEDKPRELVKHTFFKLNCSDMEHAIDQFKSVTNRINNKKAYIITLLYNCKLELD